MFVYHPFNSILCFEFLVAFGFVFLGIYLFSVLGCWFSFLGSTRDPCEYQENHSKWIVITSRTLHQLTRRWIWYDEYETFTKSAGTLLTCPPWTRALTSLKDPWTRTPKIAVSTVIHSSDIPAPHSKTATTAFRTQPHTFAYTYICMWTQFRNFVRAKMCKHKYHWFKNGRTFQRCRTLKNQTHPSHTNHKCNFTSSRFICLVATKTALELALHDAHRLNPHTCLRFPRSLTQFAAH